MSKTETNTSRYCEVTDVIFPVLYSESIAGAGAGVRQQKTAYSSFELYVINRSRRMARALSKLSGETVGLLALWHL